MHIFIRSVLLVSAIFSAGLAWGQPDVIPSAVDVRLVQGSSADQLLVQIKTLGSASFGGLLSALTVTVKYDAASGQSLGQPVSFCTAWSAFTGTPAVTNGGFSYRTYNGFGSNRIGDPSGNGGCGTTIPPATWFTVGTIPVQGSGCTAFEIGNDAFTAQNNRGYYISMNGWDVTGSVIGLAVNGGNCGVDCLGVPGGNALPGTQCNDNDPNTQNDTWSADCICQGTPICIPPAISAVTGDSPICSGSALNLNVSATGTGPLNYLWTGAANFSPNATSASVTVNGATIGSYQVTVSNACGSVNGSVNVQVDPAPSATISYTGSPYCTGGGTASVTRTGTGGGTYSASPSGLAINTNTGAINLGNSTAGSYTVTYSIAASGGCSAFSTTASVVIGTAPSATISYSGSPYCTGGGTASVTRTGTGGGTYSASPSGLAVNTNTGAINLGNSTAGSYTVTYSIAASGGCSAFSTTASVVIGTAPSATISYSGSPYCTGGGTASVTRTGTGGGTYSASPAGLTVNAMNGTINLNTSAPGSYTVIYSIPASGGCSAFGTTTAVTLYAVGDSCDDGDPNTVNDVITADCTCQGEVINAIGETGGPGAYFSLHPNPSREGAWIKVDPYMVGGQAQLQLMDVQGRTVLARQLAFASGEEQWVTWPKGIQAGVYMLRLNANDAHYVVRLVVE